MRKNISVLLVGIWVACQGLPTGEEDTKQQQQPGNYLMANKVVNDDFLSFTVQYRNVEILKISGESARINKDVDDYDYFDNDELQNIEFEDYYSDFNQLEIGLQEPPVELVLYANLYLDPEWIAEFGRKGLAHAEAVFRHTKELLSNKELSTKIDIRLREDKDIYHSRKHLEVTGNNYDKTVLSELKGTYPFNSTLPTSRLERCDKFPL